MLQNKMQTMAKKKRLSAVDTKSHSRIQPIVKVLKINLFFHWCHNFRCMCRISIVSTADFFFTFIHSFTCTLLRNVNANNPSWYSMWYIICNVCLSIVTSCLVLLRCIFFVNKFIIYPFFFVPVSLCQTLKYYYWYRKFFSVCF